MNCPMCKSSNTLRAWDGKSYHSDNKKKRIKCFDCNREMTIEPEENILAKEDLEHIYKQTGAIIRRRDKLKMLDMRLNSFYFENHNTTEHRLRISAEIAKLEKNYQKLNKILEAVEVQHILKEVEELLNAPLDGEK